MSPDLLYPTRLIMAHPALLHYLPLGLKNFKLLPHRWQNHSKPIKVKFNVDMRRNWPLGSEVLSRACFCQPETTRSSHPGASQYASFNAIYINIALFLNLDVTFYHTCVLEVKLELFLLWVVLPF